METGSEEKSNDVLLRRLVGWKEKGNQYQEGASFLEFFHKQNRRFAALRDWEQFWGLKDTGSAQGRIRFAEGTSGHD